METNLTTILQLEVMTTGTKTDVDKLAKLLLQNESVRISDDIYHTEYEDSRCPPHPIVDEIINEIRETVLSTWGKRISLDTISGYGYWGHIHHKNMSTNTHHHSPSHLSAVVYLSVPKGSGNIVFYPTNKISDHYYWFPPEKRKILIFPSWIPHMVTRHAGDKPRVSLSLNFRES